jgi:acyl-coenzyme A synthetase/AMP-(fatty) acid ligase
MSDWLRGSSHDVALAFGADVVRYDELARAADVVPLPRGDGPVGCPAGTEPVALVATVLAALDRGRPVLVGGDQAAADGLAGLLPAGTELALLTSGSSGRAAIPRVVARTNASWLASAGPLARLAGLGAGDRIAATGPLHVSMHLYAVLHALWLGATATDSVAGATAVHATPTRLARLLDDPTVPPTAIVAGAASGGALRRRAAARGIRVTEYYGAAELSFVAAGRDGRLDPFPGVEVELRRGSTGHEVWARSPYLALDAVGDGMLRRGPDGFATVGDLAERTADGGIRILGRGDAAITTAGATVLAEHVEARLAALPGVDGSAVLGEAHEVLGQRILAVVELADGVELEQVVTAARATLSPVELPRRWFVHVVPRTDSGKVARGALRAALADGSLGDDGYPAAAASERSAS